MAFSRDRFESVTWFHSFDLRDGTVLRGMGPLENLQSRADKIMGGVVAGKTVLDIGAWDGFFSFEAERQGAKRVLATDHFCWSGPGWGTKAGFDLMHEFFESSVESVDIDLDGLDPAALGVFDVVLFLGVLYHLPNPYGGLAKAAAMCGETLIVETVEAMSDVADPVMRYYSGHELNNDGSNFWAPNAACLSAMLKDQGFKDVTYLPSSDGPGRLLAIARR